MGPNYENPICASLDETFVLYYSAATRMLAGRRSESKSTLRYVVGNVIRCNRVVCWIPQLLPLGNRSRRWAERNPLLSFRWEIWGFRPLNIVWRKRRCVQRYICWSIQQEPRAASMFEGRCEKYRICANTHHTGPVGYLREIWWLKIAFKMINLNDKTNRAMFRRYHRCCKYDMRMVCTAKDICNAMFFMIFTSALDKTFTKTFPNVPTEY